MPFKVFDLGEKRQPVQEHLLVSHDLNGVSIAGKEFEEITMGLPRENPNSVGKERGIRILDRQQRASTIPSDRNSDTVSRD